MIKMQSAYCRRAGGRAGGRLEAREREMKALWRVGDQAGGRMSERAKHDACCLFRRCSEAAMS